MEYNDDLTSAFQQAQRASSSSTSILQRFGSHPPPQGTFSATAYPVPRPVHAMSSKPPKLVPSSHKDPTKVQQSTPVTFEPAHYTLDNDSHDAPGTAAYYKSWAFRKKVNAGTNQVPGGDAEHRDSFGDIGNEVFHSKSRSADEAKSLVLVFSRTSVRRADTQRKFSRRMQRSNRRM
ncbi:hypothetical protein EJ07DRAFT_159481 [Lizonia empirigonia]|nr:hypothetical protein EJ07DRAFT_159481 [Lizonia empirigonia]